MNRWGGQAVISVLLLTCAVYVYLRPQHISTLNGYSEEQLRNVDLRKVRRTAGGGLALLAVVIGGGSWLLSRAGVDDATLTVLGIIVIFAGVIGLMARVETFNRNR